MKTALVNGKIYIERGVFKSAVLSEDGIIKATGTDEEILAAAGKDAKVIDCEGRTVIPGINDSHMHLLLIGSGLYQADTTGVKSIEDLIEKTKAFAEKYPERCVGGIHSIGWNQDLFTEGEKRIPTRHDLDKISTEVPVVLERICSHVVSANTKAIEMRGLGIGSAQFSGGTFELEEDGYPSGVFTENACAEILKVIPPYTAEQREDMFINAMNYAVEHGITSVQSNDAGCAESMDLVFPLVHRVYDSGKAKFRYHHQVCCHTVEEYKEYLAGEYRHGDYSHPWLTLGPLKLFRDGSLGGRTATMRHEYLDDPGNYGVEATHDEEMMELCRMADEVGMQVVTHVIGDKAIEDTVRCYESVLHNGKNPLRHGLVHCQITDMPLLERIAKDDILTLYQPIFLDYDMHAVISRCGEQLSSTSYAFGTMNRLNHKAVSYGTDSPVEDCNPFPNIYSAVTRKDKNGYPEGGFFPNECVDVYDAVDAYTEGSAYAQFMENEKGRIKPGYMADMTVLDKDIFTCDPMEIRSILPVMTIVGGKVVYEK
jgi:predicted amidohydrolase YtcJ